MSKDSKKNKGQANSAITVDGCGWDAVPTSPMPAARFNYGWLGPNSGQSMHTIQGTFSTPESPSHYSVGDKQAWDVMKDLVPADAYEGYLTLNVVKYLVRHRKKNGKEDLLKARKYLDKLIEVCYESGGSGGESR